MSSNKIKISFFSLNHNSLRIVKYFPHDSKLFFRCFSTFFLLFLFLCGCNSKIKTTLDNDITRYKPSIEIEKDFLTPPDYARPRVYWWWLEGNISNEGILNDLTEMNKVGIKGAIIFDGGSSSYGNLKKTKQGEPFGSKAWNELFFYACQIADSLGIEISLNNGSGWNAGGPWVTPELNSKKIIWNESIFNGPKKINLQLPIPDGVLNYNGKDYWKPIRVIALKLDESANDVKPLKNFDLKAVNSIKIPYTDNELGYNWDIFNEEEELYGNDYHSKLSDIIDISKNVDIQGNISWDVPKGKWLVLRFISTGTGIRVSTHSPGGGGLAIDYMSNKTTELYYQNTVPDLIDTLNNKKISSLKYLHDPSWELGAANWTDDFAENFKKMHGYSIYKYLPILTGKVIENRDISNRFLYDFRRTIADLICRDHYAKYVELAKSDGLGVHSENGGPHPAPFDALKNLGQNTIPMGEFWVRSNTHRVEAHRRHYVKQTASAAHIYGKRFIAAEGLTSIGPHWEEDFFFMKPTLDRSFCEGLNRLVIHTFTHSPLEEGKPGIVYFAGTHFNPNVTWWNQSKALLDYTSRISFMLSQGIHVADVCFYYGDNVPNQVPLKHIRPDLGEGYDYDVANTEAIVNRMSVRNKKIVFPDGKSYHVLVLPNDNAISIEVLKKVSSLVKQGATVIGPKPTKSIGLKDFPKANQKVKQIANNLWGEIDGHSITVNSFGKGEVIWGQTIREVLKKKEIIPDFEYLSNYDYNKESGTPPHHFNIDYIHRSTESEEIYFIVNRNDHPDFLNATFRVTDKVPELWCPATGERVDQMIFTENGNSTSFPLFLEPYGSVMVVFRKELKGNYITSIKKNGQEIFPGLPTKKFEKEPLLTTEAGQLVFLHDASFQISFSNGRTEEFDVSNQLKKQDIEGPWKVQFSKEWGGPELTELKELVLWNDHPDSGIKYYSGTAIYKNTFDVSANLLVQKSVFLDLGEIYNIAEVTINGENTGVWWIKPFRKDVSEYLQKGENLLEIKITNLWPNRIIGDQLLPEGHRFARTNVTKFKADYPLLNSGLAGPVTLSFYPIKNIK